jgi:hypothetical protein
MLKKYNVKQLKEKVEHLKAERKLWEDHWQDVADYILPRKNTITVEKSPGDRRGVNLLTNVGVQCNELLSGALHGLLTNPNAPWMELTTGDLELDRDDQVRMWLQKTTKDIHNVLNNSNFQTEVHELYTDLAAFGTAPMYLEEDARDVIRCSTRFIAEIFIDENAQGVVNQVYREWKWDAMKLVEQFGFDNLPKKVQESFKKGGKDKFVCIHAVYPREIVDPRAKSAFPFVSQYVLPEENHEIQEGGFREFPYVVPRWAKAAGEKYGRSPGMNALPEVKTLNVMNETVIIGAQKFVDPPLQLPDDGFILPIATFPGGMNFYRSGTNDKIEPVFNDTRVDFGFEVLKEREQRVREAFYVDQLQLQQNGPQMTATEVLQRTEEKMRLLGPMLGRMQAEFLRPLIDRVFDIMLRTGKIDKAGIPPKLAGKKIDVRYSSLIAKSQRLADGQNLMRSMEALTPFVNMDPSVTDNINGDMAFKVVAETYGLPQEVQRSKKEVKDIRDARAQAQQEALAQQQQAHEAQQMQQGAETMKTASEIPTGA